MTIHVCFSNGRRELLRSALFATLSMCALPSCTAFGWDNKNDETTSNDLKKRGTELRLEIQKVYEKLKRDKTPLRGYKIEETVEKYIPIGSSFDDAENILRFAGFKVNPRPEPNKPPRDNRPKKFWYHVSASRIIDGGFLWGVQVIVTLSPKDPYDYSNVARIGAGIFFNSV